VTRQFIERQFIERRFIERQFVERQFIERHAYRLWSNQVREFKCTHTMERFY